MIEEVNYISYKGNEDLIQEYFNALFVFKEKKAVAVLKQFSELKGYFIDDYQACYFAAQFSPKDVEEYFGEEGVVFVFTAPFVPEDCDIILTYEEFYQVEEDRYQKFARTHLDKRDEIMRLLECLKTAISDVTGHS